MGSAAAIVCGAYFLGLLSTAIPFGGWLVMSLGTLVAIARCCYRAVPFRPQIWLLAGLVGLLGSFYFHWRLPHPSSTDISRLLSPTEPSLAVLVEGQVASLPHRTRSDKAQFWLTAQNIAPVGDGKPISGKVYVTVPPHQATNLHPGQIVRVDGTLYQPAVANNPGGFDFKQYLQQANSFAGLRGEHVEIRQAATGWGWWQVQQRIVQAQAAGLGSPEGALVSAMVLGGKAVDLPYAVKDAFVRVGLAHALAASGFQTSLILGVVLALTRRYSERIQGLAGAIALGSFVALAGGQPAVLRAALMGAGSLIGLVFNRKVKPLGALWLTGMILLLVYPVWIFDLGFQLSFLATLGLLVTVPPLTKRLDWLPSAIAPAVAVPIAAYLWTLPLQLSAFGVLSPYSIPANLVTTPFISVISLGGMVSALAAIAWAPAGSALAGLLKYPAQLLIFVVQGFTKLPGNAYAIGTISILIVLTLYGLLGLCSFQPWWQKRWRVMLAGGVLLLLLPLWAGANFTQITVLATQREPLMVIRDRGRLAIAGSSDTKTMEFTLLPFLQKTGINQIDWAIAPDARTAPSWETLAQQYPVKYLLTAPTVTANFQASTGVPRPTTMPLPLNQTVRFGQTQIQLLSTVPAITQVTYQNTTWLWLGKLSAEQQQTLEQGNLLPQADVLWWSNQSLSPSLVNRVKPKAAIASNTTVDAATRQLFQKLNIPLYITGQDGAIQWTPKNGFQTPFDVEDGEPGM